MTKNLENLVTQLQSMESSMISVMFDLATKLASLSDISFLLLVESQGNYDSAIYYRWQSDWYKLPLLALQHFIPRRISG